MLRHHPPLLGLFLLLLVTVACASEAPALHGPVKVTCPPGAQIKVLPPADGMYTGAYLSGLGPDAQMISPEAYQENIKRFTRLSGKRPAIIPIFSFWFNGIKFPKAHVEAVWETGAVPQVLMSPMSSWDYAFQRDPVYHMQNFIDGKFDEALTQYALEAKATGIPIAMMFCGEVNMGWSCSGEYNGGGVTTGYGDPDYPDGPERYRDAYRHVIDIFRQAGADNVTWFFGGALDLSEEMGMPWNALHYYYPGDDYIDWLEAGVWGYYPPSWPDWQAFPEAMDKLYGQLTAISSTKPIQMEMGVIYAPQKGDMAAWITEAYHALHSGRWPQVKSIRWWDERAEDEAGNPAVTAIDVTPEVLRAFRQAVADPFFVSQPQFHCGSGGFELKTQSTF